MDQKAPPDPQAPLLAWLGTGAAHGLAEATVERIDTHAAIVFLVGRLAYKLKRAVRYSFLDFTTLAARRSALEAELRLNRRTAPELYRRVLPVTRSPDGGLVLDGAGPPVEWLLEMRRFDQTKLLDRLAVAGALDATLIERLADVVANFHEQAERRAEAGGHGAMDEVVRGNAKDLADLTPAIFDPAPVAEVEQRTAALLARQSTILEDRRCAGKVRRCHGDLHLGNIVMLDQRPVLFDCLEFDEALASIDTMYDLAFLLMDLCHRDLRPLAGRLLDRYLDLTADDAGTALLPLCMAIRATIRAKIEGFNARVAAHQDAEPERAAAGAYLQLAQSLLMPAPARLIAIGGVSGTGKSTLGRALAPGVGAAPGAVLLRSDLIRKHRFGVAPTDRLGPEAYREPVSRAVYDQLAERATRLLRAGRSVIVDAVFLDPGWRCAIEAVAERAGAAFTGLWLEAPAAVLRERLARRVGDASDATAEILDRQLAGDPGPIAWHPIDAGGSPDAVVATARRVLCSGT